MDVLAQVERSMIELRRSMTRRTLAKLAAHRTGQAIDPALADVIDAVEEGPEPPDTEVTVGLVAARLGIDPSRASRLISAAIKDGYLRRVASQGDGRRITLELTRTAQAVIESTHQSRQALYERLMHDWSDRDRATFAKLLTRFTGALTEIRRQPAP